MSTAPQALQAPPSQADPLVSQFASKVRAKYPGAYDDLDDTTLAQKVVSKHPEYSDMLPSNFTTQYTQSLVSPQGSGAKPPLPSGLQGPPLTGYEAFATPQSDVKYAPDPGAAAMLPVTGTLVGGELGGPAGAAAGGAAGTVTENLIKGLPQRYIKIAEDAALTYAGGKALEMLPSVVSAIRNRFDSEAPNLSRAVARALINKYVGPEAAGVIFPEPTVPSAGPVGTPTTAPAGNIPVPPPIGEGPVTSTGPEATLRPSGRAAAPRPIPTPPPGPVGTATNTPSTFNEPLPPPGGGPSSTGPAGVINPPPGSIPSLPAGSPRPVDTEQFLTGLVKSRILTPEQDAQGARMFGDAWQVRPGEGPQGRASRLLGLVRAGRAAQGMADTGIGPTIQPPPVGATTTAPAPIASPPPPSLASVPLAARPASEVYAPGAMPTTQFRPENAGLWSDIQPQFSAAHHAELEAQAGRPLTATDAAVLDRANLERQMPTAGGSNETLDIRAGNKQEMEQPDVNRYTKGIASIYAGHALVNGMAKYNVVPGRPLTRTEQTKVQTVLNMAPRLKPYEVTARLHAALGMPAPPNF